METKTANRLTPEEEDLVLNTLYETYFSYSHSNDDYRTQDWFERDFAEVLLKAAQARGEDAYIHYNHGPVRRCWSVVCK